MSLSTHTQAILALLATSLLVRVIPVFLPLRLSESARGLLERVLPMAVFLNFSVYIAWTEIRTAPLAAMAAMGVVGIITLSTRTGLILTTCAGTLVYAGVRSLA